MSGLRLVWLFLAWLGAGCGGTRVEPVGDPGASHQGDVSFQFITDAGQKEIELDENQEFEPPRIIRAPLPAYPEAALSAGTPSVSITVKFLVGVDGGVSEVSESPLESSRGGPFLEDFQRATDAAVRAWTFSPGVLRIFEPGADVDGDGEPDYRIQKQMIPVSVYYHVRFRFDVVDGAGRVRMVSDEEK